MDGLYITGCTAPMPNSPSPPEALTVHHLDDSRSMRILWLLEELGVPYELRTYKRSQDMTAPAELKKVHARGVSPVITKGGMTLAESGAIIEYIRDKYDPAGKMQPPEFGKIDDLYFLHYAEGSLMPLLVDKLIFKILPDKAPYLLRPMFTLISNLMNSNFLDPRLEVHAELIEEHLAKSGDFFAGGDHPTAADYMMIFPLESWSHRYPELIGENAKAYVERIHSRPAYQRAVEKTGGHSYAQK
ncbi:thioredoxin-like protein [Obba rivulosa]|uniref:glutathione transferase n=1 Tax=Obba rivulosa TaxID=1052685 RepID=A0A8E2AMN6_9APHY|nr:thioredoxin-like protein [Obba rivulosa]